MLNFVRHLSKLELCCARESLHICTRENLCTQFYLTKHLATQAKPKTQQNVDISFQRNVKELLRNDANKPSEDITLFIRHSGQLFEYNRVLQLKHPTAAQAERIQGDHIKKSVINPTSIEDYLYIKPSPVKSFPSVTQLPSIYANLSKSRLTLLVVLTSMGGYAMAPGIFDLSTLCLLSAGTALQSAAANATNQTVEVKYDTQMYRTRNRVLVRGLISREHAAVFAGITGVLGSGLLWYGVNPLTCYIGIANYLLYTSIYTPMKRISITNTWVGSVVGALPPLMGWTAATNAVDIGGLWIAALLYIWQFPHFKALSWNIRSDYQRAGYMMSSVIDPEMCKRVAFRHTVLMTLACLLGPSVGTTTNMFLVYSLPCNLYGVYLGWRFYYKGDSNSSRKLFRFSLIQIPYLIIAMLISKNWQQQNATQTDVKVA